MAYLPPIQPLLLTSGYDVQIRRVDHAQEERPAWTEKLAGGDKRYTITINDAVCVALWRSSWVSRAITYETFVTAILLHEVAHVVNKSLAVDRTPYGTSDLFALLDNALEDSRSEFWMAYDYPLVASYLRYLLAAIYEEVNAADIHASVAGNAELFLAYVRHFTLLVRFGVVSPGADPDFISFLVPLTLSATRNDRANSLEVAQLVLSYLQERFRDDEKLQQSMERAGKGTVPVTGDMAQDVLEGYQELGNAVLEALRSGLDGQGDGGGSGEQAGHGQSHVVIAENDFARSVLIQEAAAIAAMHTSWRLLFEGLEWDPAYEGELLPEKQVDAYLHSMTGDEEADYALLERTVPSAELVFLGDVSGSTRGFKEAYAKAKVMLLASPDGIAGLRLGAIDFSDDAEWVKKFEEPILLSRVSPRSFDGTQTLEALKLLEEAELTQEEHWAFILTDGVWDQSVASHAKIRELERTRNIQFTLIHLVAERGSTLELTRRSPYGSDILERPMWRCTLETLPQVVYREVQSRLYRRTHYV